MSSKLDFSGRVFAITGGASGMGLAITRALAADGADVYVADIAKQAPAELADLSSVHFSGSIDITNRGSCHDFMAAIPGRLDGLVNCAGICPNENGIATDELYSKIIGVNLTGTWHMGTEALLRMKEQDSRTGAGLLDNTERSLPAGSIVNITSGAGMRGIAKVPVYCAAKHAVVGLTRAWAKDWPNLRVNAVAPGVTNTPMVQGDGVEKLVESLKSRIPLGRMAHATDIADAVLFLLSDSSSFITGQIVPVNGGSD